MENVLQIGMHRREGIGKLAAALKLRVQVGAMLPSDGMLPSVRDCIICTFSVM